MKKAVARCQPAGRRDGSSGARRCRQKWRAAGGLSWKPHCRPGGATGFSTGGRLSGLSGRAESVAGPGGLVAPAAGQVESRWPRRGKLGGPKNERHFGHRAPRLSILPLASRLVDATSRMAKGIEPGSCHVGAGPTTLHLRMDWFMWSVGQDLQGRDCVLVVEEEEKTRRALDMAGQAFPHRSAAPGKSPVAARKSSPVGIRP